MSDRILAAYRRHTLADEAARNVAHALERSPDTVVILPSGHRISFNEGDTAHCRGVPVFPRPSLRAGINGTSPGTDPLRDGAGIHHDNCTCQTCR